MRSQRSASYQNPTPPCRLDQTLLGTHVADAHRPYTSCRRPLRSYELALSFGASNVSKAILVHCTHRLLSKLARILCKRRLILPLAHQTGSVSRRGGWRNKHVLDSS